MDTSDLCDEEGMATYQTMIGQIQWVVALGRIDVFVACMTMSRWRAALRIGHLERVKFIYGYLYKFEAGYCRVETDEPDLSHLPEPAYDWGESIYGNVTEEFPDDAPEPLGKPVVLTTYVDANLYHDLITGRALTAVIHFVNGMFFDYYTKRQATVECTNISTIICSN